MSDYSFDHKGYKITCSAQRVGPEGWNARWKAERIDPAGDSASIITGPMGRLIYAKTEEEAIGWAKEFARGRIDNELGLC